MADRWIRSPARDEWALATTRTQIDSFHLFPLRSMTLTLKSTPIVAVRAEAFDQHQRSPILDVASLVNRPSAQRVAPAREARTGSFVRREEGLVREPEQQGRFADAGCTCSMGKDVCCQSLRRMFIESRQKVRCSGISFPATGPGPGRVHPRLDAGRLTVARPCPVVEVRQPVAPPACPVTRSETHRTRRLSPRRGARCRETVERERRA